MKKGHSWSAGLALGCVWLFYLYEYMLRVAPSSMTGDLMNALSMNATQLGWMLSFYYIAYVALQIPCGVIVDAMGIRRVMTFSCWLCVVGVSLFVQKDTIPLVYLGRFLMGVGSSCAFLSCGKVASEHFAPKHFPLIMGGSMMMGLLGATFGSYVMAFLTVQVGWQKAMWVGALVGCVVAVFVWMGTEPSHKHHVEERLSMNRLWRELMVIIREPNTWWIGLYGCCMYMPLSAFAELWSTPYMMVKYSVGCEYASIPAVFFFWGGGIGCMLSAYAVSFCGKYRPVMFASACLSCALFMFEFYGPTLPLPFMSLLFGCNGMLYGVHMMCFTLIKGTVSRKAAGTAIGFTNFCVMSSGLIGGTLMGYALDSVYKGRVQAVHSIPVYEVQDYTTACSLVLGCAFMVAALCTFWIREPQTKQ